MVIKGPLEDLGEVLDIARCVGKKALNVGRVRVKPVVYPYGDGDYVVVVEPNDSENGLEGSGCSRASGVGSGKKKR